MNIRSSRLTADFKRINTDGRRCFQYSLRLSATQVYLLVRHYPKAIVIGIFAMGIVRPIVAVE